MSDSPNMKALKAFLALQGEEEYSETFDRYGDKIFVEGHFTARHKATGALADSDWCARFDMRDARVAGTRFYENTSTVAEAREGR